MMSSNFKVYSGGDFYEGQGGVRQIFVDGGVGYLRVRPT